MASSRDSIPILSATRGRFPADVDNSAKNGVVKGSVAPGFEPVREAFEANFRRGAECGAACAVTFRGETVVDLWGGVRDPKTGAPWEEDTLVTVFSTTKGISSMALAVAHSRGLFDYDERMATYWPEFARGGKQDITVRQVLSHQAGLPAIREKMDLGLLADPDRVADAIGKQVPAWTPGEHHGYHGISLGWYEGELIRRVDPEHRTIGRFFAEEVAAPLGLEFYIGLPDAVDRNRIATLQADFFALKMLFNLHKLPPRFVFGFLTPGSITNRTFSNPAVLGQPKRYNDEDLRRIELPASNGVGRVRDIAKAYGTFANGGGPLGLTPTTLQALEQPASPPSKGTFDLVLHREMTYGLGYCKPSASFRFGSSSRAYGTPGAGGSFGYADPDLQLGFAYAMNRMDYYLVQDPRELALSKAAEACAARLLGIEAPAAHADLESSRARA
jgi:CubicO group peptidase (beta-lactamase class C family)